jgi:large subunit ribosomal protein L6
MARLGNKALQIPEKVKAEFKSSVLKITGPLGVLSLTIPPKIDIKLENNQILAVMLDKTRQTNMLHGLIRGLVKNNLEGVTKGYKKELEMIGLGYKAAVEGKNLNMALGFSHPIVFPIPEGVKIEVDKQTRLVVSGCDKALVGQVAAMIRSYREPEPYGGTGIKYLGEHIIRKAGKAAAAGAAGGGAK